MDVYETLNKYIDLINNGYCCDCNELNCIDNFPQEKIANAIRKLQQENKQLKDNWNKLREYVGFEWYSYDNEGVEFEVAKDILNKMQELEQGSDNQ